MKTPGRMDNRMAKVAMDPTSGTDSNCLIDAPPTRTFRGREREPYDVLLPRQIVHEPESTECDAFYVWIITTWGARMLRKEFS